MKHVRTTLAAILALAFLLTATVICTLPAEATEAPAEISTEDMTEAPTDEAIKEYTVTFVVSGNLETPPAVKVKAGECVVEPAVDLPKDWSQFFGWYTSANLSEDTKFDFSIPITADLTLYAALEPPTVVTRMGCSSVSAMRAVFVTLLTAAYVLNKHK